MKETWDVLDKDGNLTGEIIERGKKLKEGEYHLAVHIWIKNDKNEYLIQKRAEHIKLLPGLWATTGGSVIAGECSIDAAIRELIEELGINTCEDRISNIGRIIRKDSIADLWFLEENIELDSLKLQKEEVSDAKWATQDTIEDMILKGSFYDYGDEYFKLIFST